MTRTPTDSTSRILVTGGTGYIGYQLIEFLLGKGHCVNALVRDSSKMQRLVHHPGLLLYKGDILDKPSLEKVMEGCATVFHVAGSTSTNPAHKGEVMKVNYDGTLSVLDTAQRTGIVKFIFTSTASVLGSSEAQPLTETDTRKNKFTLEYELSKYEAEKALLASTDKHLHTVIVRPTKVFGPGHTQNAYTADQVILHFLQFKWMVIPNRSFLINFAFIRDVVEGHYLAMQQGRPGEIYLLGGENKTYFEFFNSIRAYNKGGIIWRAPYTIFRGWAKLMERWQKLSSQRALMTPEMIDFLFSNHSFSSEKAIQELGYSITSFDVAMQKTVQYLKSKKATSN